MSEDRITALEERTAYLEKLAEDLSDVVARQQTEITALTKRLEMLMKREVGRAFDEGGAAPHADWKPPHW